MNISGPHTCIWEEGRDFEKKAGQKEVLLLGVGQCCSAAAPQNIPWCHIILSVSCWKWQPRKIECACKVREVICMRLTALYVSICTCATPLFIWHGLYMISNFKEMPFVSYASAVYAILKKQREWDAFFLSCELPEMSVYVSEHLEQSMIHLLCREVGLALKKFYRVLYNMHEHSHV